jgi:hypothetical protein
MNSVMLLRIYSEGSQCPEVVKSAVAWHHPGKASVERLEGDGDTVLAVLCQELLLSWVVRQKVVTLTQH